MITTVTLNTSVDKAYHIAGEIVPGSVTRLKDSFNSAGGKGLNVARIVELCGEKAMVTGFVGGHNGLYIEDLLKQAGMPHTFIHTGVETRSCINIIDDAHRSTEFLEKGEAVPVGNQKKFLTLFDKLLKESEVAVLSGSVPEGIDKNYYAELIHRAKAQGVPVILDTSGPLLAQGLMACPTLIKPNSDELSQLFGKPVKNKGDRIAAAKTLYKKGIPNVVISLGAEGALLCCESGLYTGRPPKIEVVNTVGCGDAMVGAFACSIARKLSSVEQLKRAIAVSAANALNPKTGFFIRKDYDAIVSKVIIQKIA